MKNKTRIFVISILGLLLTNCISKVKIKENQVGVIRNNRTGKMLDTILFQGKYEKDFFRPIYVINTQKKLADISMDFLYLDGKHDSINLSFDYSPVIDSLPFIFERYRSDFLIYFIIPESLENVRDTLGKHYSYNMNHFAINEIISTKLLKHGSYNGLFKISNINAKIDRD